MVFSPEVHNWMCCKSVCLSEIVNHGKISRAERMWWIYRNMNQMKIMVSRYRHTAKRACLLEWCSKSKEYLEMGMRVQFFRSFSLMHSRVNEIWTTYEAEWNLYDINSYDLVLYHLRKFIKMTIRCVKISATVGVYITILY